MSVLKGWLIAPWGGVMVIGKSERIEWTEEDDIIEPMTGVKVATVPKVKRALKLEPVYELVVTNQGQGVMAFRGLESVRRLFLELDTLAVICETDLSEGECEGLANAIDNLEKKRAAKRAGVILAGPDAKMPPSPLVQ